MLKHTKLLLLSLICLLIGGLIGYVFGNKTEVSSDVFIPNYLQKNQSTSADPLKIKGVGISLFNYISLPELTYKYKKYQDYEAAILYTPQLAKYCPPDGPNAALGVLFKIPGQYSDQPLPKPGYLLKQNGDYFISYRDPQQQCQSEADEKLEELRYFQKREVEAILIRSMNSF